MSGRRVTTVKRTVYLYRGLHSEGNVEVTAQNGASTWEMMYGKNNGLQSIYGGVETFLNTIPDKMEATRSANAVKDYNSADNLSDPISTWIYDEEKQKETTDAYACGPEFAMYYTVTGYQTLAEKFDHTFAFAVPEATGTGDNTDNWELYPWGQEIMQYLQSKSDNASWDDDISNADAEEIFSGIQDKILYTIQSGTINDVIGDDFDLTDKEEGITDDTFTLTVGGVEQDATASGNTVNFGEADGGKYPYVLTYNPNGKDGDTREQFDLAINVPVETAKSLQLAYSLTLVNKSEEAGTHKVPTNEEATLTYTSTDGGGGEKTFPKPEVSYTVKEEQPDPEPPVVNWEKSKSKTATNLDSNYESKVTLSLPAADYERTMDVVFVIDDTHAGSGIFKDAVNSLLDELAAKKNLDINVGVVAFDAVGRDWLSATSGGSYSGLVSIKNEDALQAIKRAVATQLDYNGTGYVKKVGATNTEWPVEMATEMLKNGKGEDKYLVMFSDLYGYVYRGNLEVDGKTYSNVPLSKRLGTWDQGSLSMGTKYPSFQEAYNHRNDSENQTEDGFFRDSSWNAYWTTYQGLDEAPENTIKNKYQVASQTYSGFEKSLCLTYDNLKDASKIANVIIVNNIFTTGDCLNARPMVQEMLDNLENNGTVKTYRYVTENGGAIPEDIADGVFNGIKDDLIQVVDAGSKVIDEIGSGTDNHNNAYNFDFVNNINKLKLTVNGEALAKAKVAAESGETARYNFGTAEDPDQFVLHYYQNGTTVGEKTYGECFVWDINVPVTKEAPVQLTYTVKLTNPQEADGIYGQYDNDGSKNDGSANYGLYTNNSATLYPVDSNGQDGTPEAFAKPTVSYTVGTITVTPADITIYMGGTSGENAVVDASGNEYQNSNSLPTPLFYLTVPNIADANGMTFVSDETVTGTDKNKRWKAVRVGADEDANSLYYLEPQVTDQDEIRIKYTDKNDPNNIIISDTFDPETAGEMFKDYTAELYTGTVQLGGITAFDAQGNPLGYSIASQFGTLRVRAVEDTDGGKNPVFGVTENAPVEKIPAYSAAITAQSGTKFTLNNTSVEVDSSDVGLLFDNIIDDDQNDRTQALKDRVNKIEGTVGSNTTRQYEAKYLDLVDENHGNAWVKASGEVTVYWGYPSGTDKNTEFTLYHFKNLHRDNNGGQSGFNINEVNSAEVEKVENISRGDNGISFKVGSGGFSPFVLVWETTNSGGGGGGGGHHDKPEDLNTEDHFAYIIGYPGGTVQPQGDITRAEVATIFFRMLTDEARAENWSQTNNYTDVAPADWYNNAISTLTNMGIISGEPDGSFRPNDPITRAEFTKIAVGFFEEAGNYVEGTFVDVPANAWYADFIDAAVDLGLIEGYPDGTIRPEATITRAEACTIVNRTLGRVPDKDHLLPEEDMVLWPDNSDVNAWYYAQMQEATNSHDYEWTGEGDEQIENWTEKLEDRDWDALETEWSEAGDAPGGEVMD